MASNLREGGRQRIGMMGSEDEDDGHALEIEEVEGQNSGDGEEDDEGMRMMVGMSNSNSMDGTYDDQDQDQDQGDYEDEEESLGLEPGFMPQLVKKAHFGGRRNSFWKPDLEQVFLERIKSYACLYDHRDSNWKNKVHKEGVWAAIGKEIGVAGTECRRHFKHMRDKFVRNRRTGKARDPKFVAAMSFLVDLGLIKHRPTRPDGSEVQILGARSSPNSNLRTYKSAGLERRTTTAAMMEPHQTLSSIIRAGTKRTHDHERDIYDEEEEEQELEHDCEEVEDDDEDIILADTVMEPAVTISHGNGRRHNLGHLKGRHSSPSMSNGNGSLLFTSNGLSDSPNHNHLLVVPNGFSIPRTINQTTITPASPSRGSTVNKSSSSNGVMNGNSNSNSGGPNYFFGQYVASLLDSLPQYESQQTRHKLQEILNEAESRLASTKHQVEFKCTDCCRVFHGTPQF